MSVILDTDLTNSTENTVKKEYRDPHQTSKRGGIRLREGDDWEGSTDDEYSEWEEEEWGSGDGTLCSGSDEGRRRRWGFEPRFMVVLTNMADG